MPTAAIVANLLNGWGQAPPSPPSQVSAGGGVATLVRQRHVSVPARHHGHVFGLQRNVGTVIGHPHLVGRVSGTTEARGSVIGHPALVGTVRGVVATELRAKVSGAPAITGWASGTATSRSTVRGWAWNDAVARRRADEDLLLLLVD